MQRKGRIRERIEQPVVEHETRAVPAFLAGLEHEQHGSRELLATRTEQSCGAHEHCDMAVMSAGVHGAGLA